MKKIFTAIITMIFVLALSACGPFGNSNNMDNSQSTPSPSINGTEGTPSSQGAQNQQASPNLTSQQALDIALQEAGVTYDSISELKNELDRDNGKLVYEIEFRSGNIEYSYDINADTGAVTERDRDLD